jgi:hypothetical protein
MGGERPIGEVSPEERGPEKGFESPEDERLHGYTRSETQIMGDGQLGHYHRGETNPEGSNDISNYEFQRNERRGERAPGETTAPATRDVVPPRSDRK